uniref:FAD-binding domain-containing protein n=1 Tax=Daucus carota subsp. sativus TaxID=79200 RepID=A0A161XXK2_DAUCS
MNKLGGTEGEVQHEIVIVGAGICGLATALALHRKGMQCIVLERSESLRYTGGAIGIMANGWRALHQLGVDSILRQTANPIVGTKDIWLDKNKQREMSFMSGEARCLRRSDLINTLYNALPPNVVKFGHQIVSVKLDPQTNFPILQLEDGNSISSKVLVGCDGANSVVADFLQLKHTKVAVLCSARGLTNYPSGHPFTHEFVRMKRNNTFVGRIPIDSKLVYWFVAHPWVQTAYSFVGYQFNTKISQDKELIRQYTLQLVKSFPKETVELIKDTDHESLSFTRIRYRRPWDLLLGSFRKGTVTVAGDAMHVMGPFIGQGGSAGLEDAIVLARNLAKKMSMTPTDPRSIEEALDEYVKERRMRIVRMSAQTYLTGKLITESTPLLVKFACIILMILLFRDASGHTKYDCGTL